MQKPLGALLRAARQEARVSLRDLARLTGMTTGQISMLESGARPNPGFLTIAKIAHGLGISLDQLGTSALGDTPTVLRATVERDSLRILNELDLIANEADRLAMRIRALTHGSESGDAERSQKLAAECSGESLTADGEALRYLVELEAIVERLKRIEEQRTPHSDDNDTSA